MLEESGEEGLEAHRTEENQPYIERPVVSHPLRAEQVSKLPVKLHNHPLLVPQPLTISL